MGSIGGIEKMMVFGILIIIVAILAIAFYSAIKVEDDMTPNRLRAKGLEEPIEIIDPDPGGTHQNQETAGTNKPLIHDFISSLQGGLTPNDSLKKNEPIDLLGNQDPNFTENERGGDGTERPIANLPDETKKVLSYKVQPGDSLRKIARVQLGDEERYEEIEQLNPGIHPRTLQIGQVLKLPVGAPVDEPKRVAADPANIDTESPGSYTVKTGDTLMKLSRKFYGNSTSWQKIYEANRERISNPDVLAVGTRLKIPE